MTIGPDCTGVQNSNTGLCVASIGYEYPMCGEIVQLDFSEVSSGDIVATVISVDH